MTMKAQQDIEMCSNGYGAKTVDLAEGANSMETPFTASGATDAGQHADEKRQTELDRMYMASSRKLIPLFLAIAIFNHIDRTNLSYASLQLNADLNFNAAVYGMGSSLFFVGFVLFQVPSNLCLLKVGARIWLALLLIGWGAVATCTMFIHSKASFYAVRVLLGVFEAGAFPGMWHYLSLFYSTERITKPYAWLTIGILLANVIGAPLAAGLLSMDGLGGLRGWQWLFMLEGIPSIILGVVVLLVLPSTPKKAKWLSQRDKELLEEDINSKMAVSMSPGVDRVVTRIDSKAGFSGPPSVARSIELMKIALKNPLLYWMATAGFLLAMSAYTLIFWMPIVINGLLNNEALSNLQVAAKAGSKPGVTPALLAAIPYTAGAVFTWIVAHSAQQRKELYFHTAVPLILGGITLALFAPLTQVNMILGFIVLVLVIMMAGAANGVGVALVGEISAGPAQVVAMPLYNCCSNIGGFVGPTVAGAIVMALGGFTWVTVLMGCLVLVSGLMVLSLRWLSRAWQRRLAKSRSLQLPGLSGDSSLGSRPSRGERSFVPLVGANTCMHMMEEGQCSPRRTRAHGTV